MLFTVSVVINMKKIFKEEKSVEAAKILGLNSLITQKRIRKYIIMTKENMRQTFRMKNIDERRNYLSEEINQNDSMSKKHKKAQTDLNYTEHLLILIFRVSGCVSISAFLQLVFLQEL